MSFINPGSVPQQNVNLIGGNEYQLDQGWTGGQDDLYSLFDVSSKSNDAFTPSMPSINGGFTSSSGILVPSPGPYYQESSVGSSSSGPNQSKENDPDGQDDIGGNGYEIDSEGNIIPEDRNSGANLLKGTGGAFSLAEPSPSYDRYHRLWPQFDTPAFPVQAMHETHQTPTLPWTPEILRYTQSSPTSATPNGQFYYPNNCGYQNPSNQSNFYQVYSQEDFMSPFDQVYNPTVNLAAQQLVREQYASPQQHIAPGNLHHHELPYRESNVDPGQVDLAKWNITVIGNDGRRKSIARAQEKQTKKGRKRGVPLPEIKRKQAAITRKEGACLPCFFAKVQCCEERRCKRCKGSLSEIKLCYKHMTEFGHLLSPPFLTSHLERHTVAEFLAGTKLSKDAFDIELAMGQGFPPLKLRVGLVDSSQDLLQQYSLEGVEQDLRRRYSAPIRFSGTGDTLKSAVKKYVKRAVMCQNYIDITEPANLIRSDVLKVIHNSFLKMKDRVLCMAFEVHFMNYFISHVPTFTDDSATKIAKKIDLPPSSTFGAFISSRILGREIKGEMYSRMVKKREKALSELERRLRKQNNELWLADLGTNLVFCAVMEDIQIAGQIFCTVLTQVSPTYFSSPIHPDSDTTGKEIDDGMFDRYRGLFHLSYRTWKVTNKKSAFNPIQNPEKLKPLLDVFAKQALSGIIRAAESLRDEVQCHRYTQQVPDQVLNFNNCLNICREDPSTKFSEGNSGRLIKRFLLSFYFEPCDLPGSG